MKIGIMQPYFFPYLGYWQLIHAVDKFVIYDNIKFTKKGWINRNRILHGEEDVYITLPLKKDSDFLDIRNRQISDVFDRERFLHQITCAYARAPYWKQVFPIISEIIWYENRNLFEFIFHSIERICSFLEIKTDLIISSSLKCNHSLKGETRVIGICKYLETDEYINPPGGIDLYDKNHFLKENIQLKFLEMKKIVYPQFRLPFVPNLSILDVLMFNSKVSIASMLDRYNLIESER